jgi:hypothetical protein
MREAENVRRWRMIAGDWAEHPVEKAHTEKRTIFEISSQLPRIRIDDPSGKLLDRLIGVCFSGPEYLCHEDAARYIALLHELKQFNCTAWRINRAQMKVENLPIREFGMAVVDWVQSYFGDKRGALMPSYALDTAMFVERHVCGDYQLEPDRWEIKPMIEVGERDLFRFIDTAFKSNFTSKFGGVIVRCQVPQGCAIKFQEKELIAAGEEFSAVIKRCHLSINFQDAIYLQCDIPEERGFRLDLGFRFVGEIFLSGESSMYQWFEDPKSYPMKPVPLPECGEPLYRFARTDLDFPASWVVAAGSGHPTESQLIPVPRWEAEIGKDYVSRSLNLQSSSSPDRKVQ